MIASPRPLFFRNREGLSSGLKQRSLPKRGLRGSSVNVLGRYLEVGSAGRLRLLLSLIMLLTFAYRRRSSIITKMTNLVIALSPNLRRDRVSYNGTLTQPLRFREAISALHDVVISDLRFKQKENSAYEAYKAEQKKEAQQLALGDFCQVLMSLNEFVYVD